MSIDDKNLENYLSEFRPRPLRPLESPKASPQQRRWAFTLAAAAIIILSATAGLWYARRAAKKPDANNPSPAQPPTLGLAPPPSAIVLTKLALDNKEQFETKLADESRAVLPDFQRSQSTLSVLAKD